MQALKSTNLHFLSRRISMQIKDLDLSRELSAEEQGAVQGGDATNNAALIGNGSQLVAGPSLFAVNASPTTVAQQANDNDTATVVDIDTVTKNAVANVSGSLLTGIIQGS
jgi:hypothetical protein